MLPPLDFPPSRCSLCNSLEKLHDDDPRLAFDFTPEELVKSANRSDCSSCLVILEGLRQTGGADERFLLSDVRRVSARCYGQRESGSDSLTLEVYFFDERQRVELEFYTHSQPWRSIMPRTPISGHPLSQQGSYWIQNQLDTCRSDHTLCIKGSSEQFPTRVLFICGEDDGPISVRLVEETSSQTGSHLGSYAALSHVWGQQQECMTTKATIECHKRGICWEGIPRTFQDAIKIALKLNIAFIWIDSLCIIQDDVQDWQVESAKMANTYQNAVLTIAATASSSNSSGCFPKGDYKSRDIEVKLPEDIVKSKIFVRATPKHWDAIASFQNKRHFPLLSRGWVLQERLLSPRLLHLCKAELVWECRERRICQCGGIKGSRGPNGDFQMLISSNAWVKEDYKPSWRNLPCRSRKLKRTAPRPLSWQAKAGLAEIEILEEVAVRAVTRYGTIGFVHHYHRIVEEYSTLELTKSSDRLPALSGLCERLAAFRGDFIAGLWSDSLCDDLMWRTESLDASISSHEIMQEYRGPSWSWIAISGEVKYWYDLPRAKIRIIPRYRTSRGDQAGVDEDSKDYEKEIDETRVIPLARATDSIRYSVRTSGQNPFGNVSYARITVTASCIKAVVSHLEFMDDLSSDRYFLIIERPRVFGTAGLRTENIEFFPDHQIRKESPVSLLLIHQEVCLVLEIVSRGNSERMSYEAEWRRVGIVRIPKRVFTQFGCHWMKESRLRTFTIV